ncbi:MAG TPA: hypothetical protein VK539_32495 [Myxococcaceae bacterium]|nr:hypothetical protein [Myxococcaceae bacterium]
MAKQQDQDREKRLADEDTERQDTKVDSGDVSGQGRERRDDGEVYPQKRGLGDFGTHGGPNKHASKNQGDK